MLSSSTHLRLRAAAELELRRRGLSGVSPFATYRFEPERYVREKLGWSPWRGDGLHAGQAEIIDAYALALAQQHEQRDYAAGKLAEDALTHWQPGHVIQNQIRVEAGHTVGKCVIIDDMITLSNGLKVPAADLIGTTFQLLTLVDGVPTSVEARAEFNGVEPVYELVTDSGKRITRNAQHPLYSAEATFRPSRRPIITARGFTPMATLKPGDLVAVAESLPAFGTFDIPDHAIKLLAYLLGDGGYTQGGVRFSQQEGRILDEFSACVEEIGCRLTYIGQYDYRITGAAGRTGGKPLNHVLNLLREHNMMKLGSRDKRIPEFVYQLSREKLQLFLSRLFATDGWASVDKNYKRDIGFTSASKGLIEDIIYLLQKLGVHARLFTKAKVKAWNLTITDASDQLKFIEEVGIFGKETAVERVRALAQTTHDTKQRNISARPDRPRWWHKDAPLGTRWEKIKSITLRDDAPTVAIEVLEHHTFLTQFWEHNTTLAAGLVSHFFDCFSPAIVYCFAPGHDQINDLLFKEIRKQRAGRGLPGRVLETPEIKLSGDHFVKGRATNDSHGRGTERVQGQHGPYLMFVIDEAEGVADYVFDAIRSMTSGGVSIVLMLANPRTRTSRFHRAAAGERVASFRISCIQHPNVLAGHEIIPGAVMRDYVETMIDDGQEQHAEVVSAHDPDNHTFEVPWRPGVIYQPDPEFMFRVLGIAPANIADDVFVPIGRYEAACKRTPESHEPHIARFGVDVARFGRDLGKLYIRHNGRLWCAASFAQQDTKVYARSIKDEALTLLLQGVTSLHIRVDGGGGFGGGVVDTLKSDLELLRAFDDFQVLEVHFNGVPHDDEAYADLATEIYGHTAEVLRYITLLNPPGALEADLCERKYTWVSPRRDEVKKDVKMLEPKKDFRRRMHRSPDDGDGCALACAPDRVFGVVPELPLVGGSRPIVTRYRPR